MKSVLIMILIDMSVKFDEGGDTYIGVYLRNISLKVVFKSSLKSRLKRELRKRRVKDLYDKLYSISIFIAIGEHITSNDQIYICKDYSERVVFREVA